MVPASHDPSRVSIASSTRDDARPGAGQSMSAPASCPTHPSVHSGPQGADGRAARSVGATPAIYYLHPLLAGPVDRWPSHFRRCQQMGFDCVLIAPPFAPGSTGNIFLTSDHNRLHAGLGGGSATDAFATLVRQAADHGISLMLDLVVDRVARDAPIVGTKSTWFHPADDGPPDPRQPPWTRSSVMARFDVPEVGAFWQQRMAEWLDTGIAGFRCNAAQHVPPAIWRSLISDARRLHPGASFLAWQLGSDQASIAALSDCGFDFAASSSWAWDFRSDWLDADSDHTRMVGALTAMPELPFGRRIGNDVARRRALHFAAAYGEAWLMPMGFEFGADVPLDPATGGPGAFDQLVASPPADIVADIAAANAMHRDLGALGAGTTVSAPGASVAAIYRPAQDGNDGRLLVVNARLDRSAAVPPAFARHRLGPTSGLDHAVVLPPGDVQVHVLRAAPPIVMPGEAIDDAMHAPRVAIESVRPSVDGGRYPARRCVGETIEVEADFICDGHDQLAAVLLWRAADVDEWQATPMRLVQNDVWTGSFLLERTGRYLFTVEAWIDVFGGYRAGLAKKSAAGVDIALELMEGRELVADAANRSGQPSLQELEQQLARSTPPEQLALLLSDATAHLLAQVDERPFRSRHPWLPLESERQAARFASWYELFPRSQGGSASRHGTFEDVIARLPAIRRMGFDVLYFPPIHPIGTTNRKGRNNALRAEPGDPGSPYAIGAPDGGHDAIHPDLGTLEDFRRLLAVARGNGLEIALDFAIQCSPDHPWLRDHPEWFEWRQDGSLRYAENPPKKYEDIVNVAFYADGAMPSLWLALRDVVLFWVQEGVRIFRVDNPHTKPLPFWEWMIGDVRGRHPDVVFLAEAFTRPKMMHRLAKVGFSQSYTYFTWRNSPHELREYLTELTALPVREFFRPHFFVNTPDINPLFLQSSGRAGFLIRAMLAATLSGLWGMYSGFELCEAAALAGREEYWDSEKYTVREWDWARPGNIVAEVAQLNRIRRANPALHSHLGVLFLPSSNENVLCFAKTSANRDNILVMAVSFDPHASVDVDFEIPPDLIGLPDRSPFEAEDLMHQTAFSAHTGWQHVTLMPTSPFTIWRVRPVEASA